MQKRCQQGFTLIELSIVLVVIGLIVGGVLVGQSLIAAAGVRGTISQIEKYNTAVNTFRGKYDCLPGDCANAASFGFKARGQYAGEGDGNGLLEAITLDAAGHSTPMSIGSGETGLFWVDLSTAGLIDQRFTTATANTMPIGNNLLTPAALAAYFPQAKVGQGNYIYAWSGGMAANAGGGSNGVNYYGLSALSEVGSMYRPFSSPALTVAQAYSIDMKIDDGLPQAGNVTAMYLNTLNNDNVLWAAGGGALGAGVGYQGGAGPTTSATVGATTTCFDNGGVGGTAQQYSLAQNTSNLNCALSFRFQ